MTIQRYEISIYDTGNPALDIEPDNYGKWVKWADIEPLLERRAEAKRIIKELMESDDDN